MYNDIFSMAKRDGKRVADVVNSALKEFLIGIGNGHNSDNGNGGNNETFILKNDGDITLSKHDILSLNGEVGPFGIENTGHLTFEKDIDRETLKNIDNIIIHTGTVEVPKTLYSQFLIKSEIHGKLEKY